MLEVYEGINQGPSLALGTHVWPMRFSRWYSIAVVAAAKPPCGTQVGEHDNDNDDDNGNCQETLVRKLNAKYEAWNLNLPTIPRQIHFFLRVARAVLTACVICVLPATI